MKKNEFLSAKKRIIIAKAKRSRIAEQHRMKNNNRVLNHLMPFLLALRISSTPIFRCYHPCSWWKDANETCTPSTSSTANNRMSVGNTLLSIACCKKRTSWAWGNSSFLSEISKLSQKESRNMYKHTHAHTYIHSFTY